MSGTDEDLFGSDEDSHHHSSNDEVADLFGDSEGSEELPPRSDGDAVKAAPPSGSAAADDNAADDDGGDDRREEQLGGDVEVRVGAASARIGRGQRLCALKLPAWLLMESEPFDREETLRHLMSLPKSELKDYEAPRVRWRNTTNDAGNSIRQSNARIVKWSDGSMQLLVGNEVLDVVEAPLETGSHYLYVESGDVQRCHSEFASKLMVHARSSFSVARRKPAQTAAPARKFITSIDPEIEAEQRAKRYQQNQAYIRRQDRSRLPPQEFSSAFLEKDEQWSGEESSEEEFEPTSRASMRRRYSDDGGSDEDFAERLQMAKKSEGTRGKAIMKKRSRQRSESPSPERKAQLEESDEMAEEDNLVMRTKKLPKKSRIVESDSE